MKKVNNRTKIILGVGLTLVLLIGGYLALNTKNKKENADSDQPEIKYFNIEGIDQVFINGSVTPVRSQEFVKDTSLGKLGDLQVKNGQLVEKDTLLYQYIDPNSDKEIAEIQGNIQSTQADRNKAARQLELELQELANGATTTSEEGEAPVGGNTAANRESIELKYDINGFDVRLAQMQQQLDDVLERQVNKVTAPFKGKISIPQDQNRDSAILNLTSEEYFVVGNVNEKDVEKIKVDQAANIQTISDKKNLKGKITYISETPNPSTNTEGVTTESGSLSNYTVKLSLTSTEGIKNGFHVQAAIKLGNKKILIPKKAVKNEQGKDYVLVDDFGTVLKKQITVVETKDEQADQVEVTDGLEAMDRIIVSSNQKLKDGDILATDEGVDPIKGAE